MQRAIAIDRLCPAYPNGVLDAIRMSSRCVAIGQYIALAVNRFCSDRVPRLRNGLTEFGFADNQRPRLIGVIWSGFLKPDNGGRKFDPPSGPGFRLMTLAHARRS